jgi:uncharacterized protein YggE
LAGILLLSGLVWSRGQAVALPGPAIEAGKEAHTLRTSGSASVRIKPDAARVFFGVQTQAATVKEARTENNRRVHKIMEALVALKIPELKTKTSDVQVDILYGRNDGSVLPPITGYRVSTTFTVLVQDDDPAKLGGLAGRVLDAALESGANSVQQVVFLSKNGMNEARRKALTQAVEDALANAKALAAGARKGQIDAVTIEGQPVYRDRYSGGRNQMAQSINVAVPEGGDSEGPIVVGDLEVTCQVSVVCTF